MKFFSVSPILVSKPLYFRKNELHFYLAYKWFANPSCLLETLDSRIKKLESTILLLLFPAKGEHNGILNFFPKTQKYWLSGG